MIKAILLIAVAAVFGVWWWRKNYVPSPLEKHYADLEMKQRNGNLAQLAAYATQAPVAMMGTGWATTTQINPNQPLSLTHNRPGKLMLNYRWAQPTGANA